MSDQENTTPGAILNALTKPAVPAGTVKRGKGPERSDLERELAKSHKPVQVKQPAAGRWRCDNCLLSGRGGTALLAHTAVSGHKVFTDLDYR